MNPARYLPSVAYRKAGILVVTANLRGNDPQSAANFGTFFIAPYKCVVLAIDVVHGTASTSGTVMVERLQGTEAKAAGDDLLTAAISFSGTADTVNAGTLTTTVANLELADGDRLGLENAGTLTSGANLVVTVTLCPIP